MSKAQCVANAKVLVKKMFMIALDPKKSADQKKKELTALKKQAAALKSQCQQHAKVHEEMDDLDDVMAMTTIIIRRRTTRYVRHDEDDTTELAALTKKQCMAKFNALGKKMNAVSTKYAKDPATMAKKFKKLGLKAKALQKQCAAVMKRHDADDELNMMAQDFDDALAMTTYIIRRRRTVYVRRHDEEDTELATMRRDRRAKAKATWAKLAKKVRKDQDDLAEEDTEMASW